MAYSFIEGWIVTTASRDGVEPVPASGWARFTPLKPSDEGGATIDDTVTGTSTAWSSKKTSDQIKAAIDGLVDGAPEALDTLKELADALDESGDSVAALVSQIAAVGDTDKDFVATFEASLGA